MKHHYCFHKLPALAAVFVCALYALRLSASPLDPWILRNAQPAGNSFTSVAYGSGVYVAVENIGLIATSPDAIHWTTQTPPTNGVALQSIVYAQNQFVAVGTTYTDPLQGTATTSILTSPDGTNWTSQPSGAFSLAQSICYGAGQYVTVGYDGAIANSPDGTNWGFAGSLSSTLSAVAYGSNLFVAVGEWATMLTSPDGNVWSVLWQGSPPEPVFPPANPSNLMAVAYGSNMWVAAGEGILLNSPDGINWTNQPSPVYGADIQLNSVCYGSNQFVAVGAQWQLDGVLPFNGSGTSVILVSPDGIHWSSKTKVPSSLSLNSVTYSDPGYIAVGNQGVIETSPDGVTWTNRGFGAAAPLSCAAYGNGTFVAAGSALFSSPDGIHWTTHANPSGYSTGGITFGSNLFVAVGAGGSILVSRDGSTWATRALSPSNTPVSLNSVTYGNGLYVAGGASGLVYTSTNGLAWHSQSGPSFAGIAYGNNEFVAVGGSGAVSTSADGVRWKTQTPPTTANLAGVAFGAGVFVAAGSSGILLTSPDGINWSLETNLATYSYPFQAVTFGNGIFLAVGNTGFVGSTGIVGTSTDGYTWNGPAYVSGPQNLYGVTAGNGGFLAVSINGSILQSEDSLVPATLGPLLFQPGGAPQFTVAASSGQSYAIQASSDLINWITITNLSLSTAVGQFDDPSTTNYPQRFYRAVAP